MRHGKKFNHLGRKSAHRKAMLANMAISLIEHKHIKTTLAKAKALRVYVEPLITKGKNDTTHSRRVVFSYLQSKEAIKELFGAVAEKIGDRPGGYTRILKLGTRRGDNAEMAFIELVDFNEYIEPGGGTRRKKKRRAKGKKKPGSIAEAAADETEAEEVIVEEVVEEAPAEEAVADDAAASEEVIEEAEEVEEAVAEDEATPEAEAPKEEPNDADVDEAAEEDKKKDE